MFFGRLIKDIFEMFIEVNFVRYFKLVGYVWRLCDLKFINSKDFEMFFMILLFKLGNGFLDIESDIIFWSLLMVVGSDVNLFFIMFRKIIDFLFLMKVWLLIVFILLLLSINICNFIFINIFLGICFNLLLFKNIVYELFVGIIFGIEVRFRFL